MSGEIPREDQPAEPDFNLEDTVEMPVPEETLELLQEQLGNLERRYKKLNEELTDFDAGRDPQEIKKEMYQIRDEQDIVKKKIRDKEAPEYKKVLNEAIDKVTPLKKQLAELFRQQIDLEERLSGSDKNTEAIEEELEELEEEIAELQQQIDTIEDVARGEMRENIAENRRSQDKKESE